MHTMMLSEYPNGTWTAEPVGVAGCKPGQFAARNTSLERLLADEARPTMANALRTPYTFGFHLRFVDQTGRVVATSQVSTEPTGRHHRADESWEKIEMNNELHRKIQAERDRQHETVSA